MPRRLALPFLAAVTLAGCGGPKPVRVDHGWVRLAAVAGHPAAAYFEVHGGSTPATLVSVASPEAGHAEMHESRTVNGMMTMLPLANVPVAPDQTVKFEPGGRHVMLFDLAPTVKPGGTMPLTLGFADGRRLTVTVPAIAAAQPEPSD